VTALPTPTTETVITCIGGAGAREIGAFRPPLAFCLRHTDAARARPLRCAWPPVALPPKEAEDLQRPLADDALVVVARGARRDGPTDNMV
jgi:hypothetical protein